MSAAAILNILVVIKFNWLTELLKIMVVGEGEGGWTQGIHYWFHFGDLSCS